MVAEESVSNNKESVRKPGYDGRLKYYDLVGDYMEAIAACQNSGNLEGWRTNLRGLLSMTRPYMKTTDATEVLSLLQNSAGWSVITNPAFRGKAIETLHDATDKLYEGAKHMMLPASLDDEDNDWDEDEVISGGMV